MNLNRQPSTTSGGLSLQLCDMDTPKAGVNSVGVRSVGDATTRAALNPRNWIHNSLHPNEAGHDRMGDVVREWLDAHPVREAEAPAEQGTIGPPPSAPDADATSSSRPKPAADPWR